MPESFPFLGAKAFEPWQRNHTMHCQERWVPLTHYNPQREATVWRERAGEHLRQLRQEPGAVAERLSDEYGADGRFLLKEFADAVRAELRFYSTIRGKSQARSVLNDALGGLCDLESRLHEFFRDLLYEIRDKEVGRHVARIYEQAMVIPDAAIRWLADQPSLAARWQRLIQECDMVAHGYNQLLEAKAFHLRGERFTPMILPSVMRTRVFPWRREYRLRLPDGERVFPYGSDQELLPSVLESYGFRASSDASVVSTYRAWIFPPDVRNEEAHSMPSSSS